METAVEQKILHAALLVLLANTAAISDAQEKAAKLHDEYPSKPIRFLVGQAPGGGVDTVSRMLAQKLAERLGQIVVVDNRAGAAGTIAAGLAAQAAPDGYTLLVMSSGTLVTSMLLRKIAFDIRKAYAPITLLSSQTYLLVVNPASPIHSVKELIAYAKAKPGALNYASTGVGSTSHLGTELFNSATGIDIVPIAYKGIGPAMVDLISGQIQVLFGTAVSVLPNVRSGKLRALAVASAKRLQALPDLPTVSEAGVPGYELSVAYGFFAPAGTPSAVVLLLNREAGQIMNGAEMKEKLAAEGAEAPAPHTPAQFGELIAKDIVRWDKFFRTTPIKFD